MRRGPETIGKTIKHVAIGRGVENSRQQWKLDQGKHLIFSNASVYLSKARTSLIMLRSNCVAASGVKTPKLLDLFGMTESRVFS
jgi:hypothetical protein